MAVPTSGAGGAAPAFNPSLHPRVAAGAAGGGRFAPKGSGSTSSTAKGRKGKTAPKKPAVPPNGLGYSNAQWARLQKLEAMAKAGKHLSATDLHALHVAHMKRVAADKAKAASAKKTAARKTAKK